jgi:hypothetical protein
MCQPLPAQCLSLTCPLGQFLSVTSSGSWDSGNCMLTGAVCDCKPYPPLPLGDIGLYSAIDQGAMGPAMVSAYNLDYGDLMVGVVQADQSISWTFVDGVPTSTTTIVGAIDGPRGGQSAPGPDVGIYTDTR